MTELRLSGLGDRKPPQQSALIGLEDTTSSTGGYDSYYINCGELK